MRSRSPRRITDPARLTLSQVGVLARLSILAARGKNVSVSRELERARAIPLRAVRETLLQLVLFAGYPRAIQALLLLERRFGSADGERASGGSVEQRRRRGERLCRRIYGFSFGPLLRNMKRLHPALAEGIIEEGYGRVLSRPGLSLRQRELILVPLLASQSAWRQLSGHVRGAVRAGASPAELRRILRTVGNLLGRRIDRALRYVDCPVLL